MTEKFTKIKSTKYILIYFNYDSKCFLIPLCKVRNSSYEFAVLSKNKIPRDF